MGFFQRTVEVADRGHRSAMGGSAYPRVVHDVDQRRDLGIPEVTTTKHLAPPTWNKDLIHPEVLSIAIHCDPLNIRKLEITLPPMEDRLRFVRMLHNHALP